MMDLLDFCRAHGIIIDAPPPIGYWKRYQTVDHPRKRNGAVKWMGDHAFVQNHATDTEVSIWKPDSISESKRRDYARLAQQAEQEKVRMQVSAAEKAKTLLQGSVLARHAYLKAKGFPDEQGWINDGKLVIPMRVDAELVGCQVIDSDGNKKFLYGQRTSGASFDFDNKGKHYLCEGYATALSLRHALRSLKRNYVIHVCFSASNLLKLAEKFGGFVIADNDESGTGERVAKQTGLPYWMSEQVGEDANDASQRLGLFKFTQSLTKSLPIR
jgi:putative DNA primase/helicase